MAARHYQIKIARNVAAAPSTPQLGEDFFKIQETGITREVLASGLEGPKLVVVTQLTGSSTVVAQLQGRVGSGVFVDIGTAIPNVDAFIEFEGPWEAVRLNFTTFSGGGEVLAHLAGFEQVGEN